MSFGFQLVKRKILNRGAYIFSYIRLQKVLKGLSKNTTVIDCGANVGEITLIFARKNVKVYAFEPDPLAFEALKQRTSSFPNVTCYQKGIGTANRIAKMYFHEERVKQNDAAYTVSSSIIEQKINIDLENYLEIEIIDLTEFIKSLEEKVSIIKMDIEGAEIEVVEKLIKDGTYKDVDLILVETHETKIHGHDEKVKRLKNIIKSEKILNIRLNWI